MNSKILQESFQEEVKLEFKEFNLGQVKERKNDRYVELKGKLLLFDMFDYQEPTSEKIQQVELGLLQLLKETPNCSADLLKLVESRMKQDCFAMLLMYLMPNAEFNGKQFLGSALFTLTANLLDDLMDEPSEELRPVIEQLGSSKLFDICNKLIRDVAHGKVKSIDDISMILEILPTNECHQVFELLIISLQILASVYPEETRKQLIQTSLEPILDVLKLEDGMASLIVEKKLGPYLSIESFTICRGFDVRFWSTLEAILLTSEITISPGLRSLPIFKLFVELGQLITELTNDILGFKRDFEKNGLEGTNYICRLIKERQDVTDENLSIEEAFKIANRKMAGCYNDVQLILNNARTLVPKQYLQEWLQLLTVVRRGFNGHILWYFNRMNKRYT